MDKEHRRLKRLLQVVVLLAVAVVAWWHWANVVPKVSIPTRKTPKPNAYDYYVDAHRYIVDSGRISWALDNTPLSLRDKPLCCPDDRPFSLTEKEALLKPNLKPLKILEQGKNYDYKSPAARSSAEMRIAIEKLGEFRTTVEIIMLDAQVKVGHSDWNGAINAHLDAIQFGSNIPRGGENIAMLMGRLVQARGRQDVWPVVDHLTAEEAKAATRRMEEIIDNRVRWEETMTEEKWSTAAMLLETFKKRDLITSAMAWGITNDSDVPITTRLKLPCYSKRNVMANYLKFMDELILYAKTPYAAKVKPPERPDDPMSHGRSIQNSLSTKLIDTNIQAQNTLLTVTLALRAYKMENGEYPKSLSELVPGYLTKFPNDPFALSGPLTYKRTKTKYLLYSVGPDGKDDGGKWATPYPSLGRNPKPGTSEFRVLRWVRPDSVGDIVPGIHE